MELLLLDNQPAVLASATCLSALKRLLSGFVASLRSSYWSNAESSSANAISASLTGSSLIFG
jgi:hypothetical protein